MTIFFPLVVGVVLVVASSCGSVEKGKEVAVKKRSVVGGSEGVANWLMSSPKVNLMRSQVSGRWDGASAWHNLSATARGGAAKRSSYGRAPGGYVKLDGRMLNAMKRLVEEGYSFRVTSIAGGSHSRRSRHYAGIAFDVDRINGRKVGHRNPYYRKFMRRCRELGATEVLGPGDKAHSTHCHAAWPRR